MSRLTDRDAAGNWQLHGVDWKQLREGEIITRETSQRLYGALCKLRDYENIDEEPEQIEKLMIAGEIRKSRLAKQCVESWAKKKKYSVFEKNGEVYVITDDGSVKFDKNDLDRLWEHITFWLDQELRRKQHVREYDGATKGGHDGKTIMDGRHS